MTADYLTMHAPTLRQLAELEAQGYRTHGEVMLRRGKDEAAETRVYDCRECSAKFAATLIDRGQGGHVLPTRCVMCGSLRIVLDA